MHLERRPEFITGNSVMPKINYPVLRLLPNTELLLDLALISGCDGNNRKLLHDLLRKELENAYGMGCVAGSEFAVELVKEKFQVR